MRSLALMFLCALFGLAQQQPDPHLPTLTRVIQAHRLTEEQANQKYPIHFRVVVTYATDLVGSPGTELEFAL